VIKSPNKNTISKAKEPEGVFSKTGETVKLIERDGSHLI